MTGIEMAVIFAAAVVVYFMPTVMAAGGGHRSVMGVLVLNLFLGWTFLGWVIALAWACSDSGARA